VSFCQDNQYTTWFDNYIWDTCTIYYTPIWRLHLRYMHHLLHTDLGWLRQD